MAVRTVTLLTCDRCGKEEEQAKTVASKNPKHTFILESIGPLDSNHVTFDDLCERCSDRLTVLISQVKMERIAKKESEPEPEPTAKKEESTPEQV